MNTKTGRVIEAEEISISIGKADKNCPECHGAGHVNGLHCVCTMTFGKSKKIKLAVLSERTKDGGIELSLEKIKKMVK